MINVIIIVFVILAVVFCVKSAVNHFKGNGSCCGGGSGVIVEKKELTGDVVKEITVYIDGMKCNGCSDNVTNAINKIDGAVCSKVSLKKKCAYVKMQKLIDDSVIKSAVEGAGGYTVTKIN